MKDIISPPATATVPRTCSVASEMTGNDVVGGGFVEQEESSIMEPRNKKSSAWTNEKHSLYLKSIEASFIDQLYNSLDMQTSQTQKMCSSNAISSCKINHGNACTCSGQFKVLQGGCWSKKNFGRENSQMKDADKPNVSPGNPWIQHFTNGSRHGSVAYPPLRKRPLSATSLQIPATNSQMQQELGCSNTEVTDQNFAEDTSVQKANRPCSRKRMATSIIAHPDNDQVVPFCTSLPVTEIADSYVSRKK